MPASTRASSTSSPTPWKTPTPRRYFPLGDCPASHLHVGDSAYISYTGGNNALRSSADTSIANKIGMILMGEVVELIGGPVCNYGWVLWEVRTTHYDTGWTPETDGKDFWLIPIATRQLCSNALPTRLIPGKMAFVMEMAEISNRVRTDPNTSAEIIDRIKPGEAMVVLEGPKCGDGTHWWKVRSEKTGVIGWTAEGDNRGYFLAPIP